MRRDIRPLLISAIVASCCLAAEPVGAQSVERFEVGAQFTAMRLSAARVGEGRAVGACILIFPPPEACYAGETRLAFDLGGVFEIYPSRRSTVRIDVGDLATHLTSSSSRFGRRGDFAHDLQVGAGVGVRF